MGGSVALLPKGGFGRFFSKPSPSCIFVGATLESCLDFFPFIFTSLIHPSLANKKRVSDDPKMSDIKRFQALWDNANIPHCRI